MLVQASKCNEIKKWFIQDEYKKHKCQTLGYLSTGKCILLGATAPQLKISMFCVLSQNYQHFFFSKNNACI